MKTTKLLIIALVLSVMAVSTAGAQTFTRTSHWRHHSHYYRPHSSFSFGIGLGYPYYGYGYGYPYGYGAYPYGYGYGYYQPRTAVYADVNITDDATVAAVQRRLKRAGYYHGSVDGVIGEGTRSAIRAFERNNGLLVDGRIDRQLLRTMGLS
ncbi:MAG: peptidoglycan-binding domain-containing protein [Chthoniobacterales bacterium]|jgi:hypothetical protein